MMHPCTTAASPLTSRSTQCPLCSSNDVELSLRPSRGSHFCNGCGSWFTPLDSSVSSTSDKDDAAVHYEAKCSLEAFLEREYYYHVLRADDIKERLQQNGIEVN